MRSPQPIATGHLFGPLNDDLVALLRSLTDEEWLLPTAAGTWTIRDVAAHLIDTSMRRLSMDRDGFAPPMPREAFADGIGFLVNNANRDGVAWLSRLSTPMLIDLADRYGRLMGEFLAAKDPDAPARWPVSWAGDESSPNWFDVARELTERWHHQEQIRDAAGRPPRFEYLAPVLDTFARALPHTYRTVEAPDGATVEFRVVEEGAGVWTLRREDSRWNLYDGSAATFTTRVTMRGDAAWRIFTKQKIDPHAVIEGEAALAQPLLQMVAIIA
jgi:uncharacterized protein (TIGR03083 family)